MNKINFRSLALVALAAAFTHAAHAEIRIGSTPARKIAKDMSIPGKGVDGQCLQFAQALHKKLQAAGIQSKVITFSYDSLGTIGGAFTNTRNQGGAHAMVAYNDGGRVYLMDNQSWMPTWVKDTGAAGLAQQFAGMDIKVTSVR
jgi:hypothetical protein